MMQICGKALYKSDRYIKTSGHMATLSQIMHNYLWNNTS